MVLVGVMLGCARPAVRGRVLPSRDPCRVRVLWGGQARLPRHVFALVHAHDGIVGHGQAGLSQLDDRTVRCVVGHADLRVRNLVVSEPHAAVSAFARQRISPSRRP